MRVEAWSYPMAPFPPTPPVWQVAQERPEVLGWGRLAMPAWIVGGLDGGLGMVKPPTVMNAGAPPAPSQLGAALVPAPGQPWQVAQSGVPEALVKVEWSWAVKPVPGFTFMWQLLQRPVVEFITSGAPVEKLTWSLACAHSLPCTPATVEGPTCVWQKAQSWPLALTSVWVIWSWVPAGTPVLASLLAVVRVEESVRPDGRLFPLPTAEPLPLVRPWQAWQLPGRATRAWKAVALLQAAPEALASAAWQVTQSTPATPVAAWFIHW